MNAVQLHLDEAGRTLRRREAHTEAEVAKLEHEHAPNLLLVEAYEEQKLVTSAAAARVAEAEASGEATPEEKVRYLVITPRAVRRHRRRRRSGATLTLPLTPTTKHYP